MSQSFFAGLFLGYSLIISIGAQNAFILKQGLLKKHIFWLCLFCSASDSLLIAAGVFGFAPLMAQYSSVILVMKYFGAGFLFVYGAMSLHRAYTATHAMSLDAQAQSQTLSQALLLCAGFTWLNPQVYLDTVILVGSISAQYSHIGYFALGAILSSFTFFFALGYLARFLSPIFTSVKAWKILDAITGIMMWAIAYSLVVGSLVK
ncbi:MAG: LysE/ArgO family amino acid transporter [Acinetobacter sp.]|nr:LysE/ArgO family amino acid transporter [Acinetobacter sp.]